MGSLKSVAIMAEIVMEAHGKWHGKALRIGGKTEGGGVNYEVKGEIKAERVAGKRVKMREMGLEATGDNKDGTKLDVWKMWINVKVDEIRLEERDV